MFKEVFKNIIHSSWAVLHCLPQLLGNYRSYLASALPSAVIPRSNDRAETQSLVWLRKETSPQRHLFKDGLSSLTELYEM